MDLDLQAPQSVMPPTASEEPTFGLSIVATLSPCTNYASWQNSVPLLQSLEIRNDSADDWNDLKLELATSPSFTQRKAWNIQQVRAGESLTIRERDIQLDPAYLNGLNESERAIVQLRLLHEDRQLAEATHDVRMLARDEWGGLQSMGELLAAFVMPNDPAISRLLKLAGTVLQDYGHSPALDGYQSKDPRRAYLLIAAIWSALSAQKLTYANPPKSFEQVGQKTRRPTTVLAEGLATCLDTSLLFAAAIEAIGLNPVIVMTNGHCFVGAWLTEQTLPRLIETDGSEIRKAIAGRELITFETTLITHRPPARFEDAVAAASAATSEVNEEQFVAAVDIARSRMVQIRPLASHDSQPNEDVSPEAGGPIPLPALPNWGSMGDSESEVRPTTPGGRIERWQRKLLDLSLRNRLLNYTANKQSVRVVCPDISNLEDQLAAGARLRMISLPDDNPLFDRDRELHRQTTTQDLDIEFARQALARGEISCAVDRKELSRRLTDIYRKVKNDLAEGGSNTLFLAVGFLKWKRPEDDKICRAPLLLVPVKLLRNSAISPYYLAQHEDDVRFNATLIQLLKKDFDRDITFLETNLPDDDNGVDVPQVLEQVRRAIRDIPGFEVSEESALSTFSFAKYLMWKDLVDRVGQLEHNRVVRHLIRNPDRPFTSETKSSIPLPAEIDVRFDPKGIFHPLPADSSQLAAIMAASEGHDFVLVGPPGTGKSQTIANLIAQCLATGKTVLFVAEKTAALDVVYRRLRKHGLGDCCVELHSNRAERRRFLDQLKSCWLNSSAAKESDWVTISDKLKLRRDELNKYVGAIHAKHANGWTAFDAMAISVRGNSRQVPMPEWSDTVEHNADGYSRLTDLVASVSLTFAAIDPSVELSRVRAQEWSASWESNLLLQCDKLASSANRLAEALEKFSFSTGLSDKKSYSLTELESINRLAKSLLACAGQDVQIIFNKQFAKFPAALGELRRSIQRHRETVENCSGVYNDDSLESIPLEDLDNRWRVANASFWPMSWLRRRSTIKRLKRYATGGAVNPANDIALLRTRLQELAAVRENLLAGQTEHWKEVQTDTESLEVRIRLATELRQAILAVGQPLNATTQITKTLLPALKGGTTGLRQHATEVIRAIDEFSVAARSYGEIAKALPFDRSSLDVIGEATLTAREIQSNRTHLQRWTAWCGVKQLAIAYGLAPFVSSLEAGQTQAAELPDVFRLAYARWWLPKVIDDSPVLRTFQRYRHEDVIQDFGKLDDLARTAASIRVRQAIAHHLPSPDTVPRQSELGLLRHQMTLTRPSKAIREVIGELPETFSKLAPCLLMSPLSIAQYLPASQALFDVVVFDEASQIPTWDAIGAIARGRQTIIVGDPKQLPPTNFFGRSESDEENDELEDHEKDLESILDESQAAGLPTLKLNWHYRSRHESLIAFSNWHYYKTLVTFPAADSADLGVMFRYLPHSVYDRGRGKTQTNRVEAEAIVEDAVRRMKLCLDMPEQDRFTFGVITFNSKQQSLIEDLFDQAQRDNPPLEWFFSDDRIEPTVVKNLENVQGDERDIMYFSVTYGPNAVGQIPLTFGPLNRDGGERRLNVAITRARRQLIVHSSFKGDQLNAAPSGKRGVIDLKNFLDYAEKGAIAMAAQTKGSVGGYDSPFEEAVAEALTAKGWQVVPQVGVSGFRVDLGVVHPDKAGAYLAGVECDGATYHRAAIARDRDKTRQGVLEDLGWNILRVWSPDWWYDSSSALERIHMTLTELLENKRKSPAAAVQLQQSRPT